MQIKILTPKSAEAYRTLRLYSFIESPYSFSESYEDEKDKTILEFAEEIRPAGNPLEKFTLGAFTIENRLISILTLKRDDRSKARHKAMVHAMYTDVAFRNQGIGELVLQKAIAMSKDIPGLEQIHLWVLHHTRSASRFYLKTGFESQGTLVKDDLKIGDTYLSAEYMVLYLNKH